MRAEKAVRLLYRMQGYPRPQIIWITSPREFTDELHKSHHENAEGERMRPPYFRDRNGAYLGAARYYTEPIVKRVDGIISDLVPRLQRVIRFDGLWAPPVCGPGDARDFAMADFFQTKRHREEFAPFMATAQHCGSFVLYQGAVVFLERPSIIKLDERGRLHSFDGPALVWRDHSGRFAIHGLPVDRKWIETPADQINIADLLAEENAEVRTALIAKYGLLRLLQTSKHKVISKRKGNALVEFTFPGWRWSENKVPSRLATTRFRALHLTWHDKTGPKETILPVPRTLREFGDDRPENIDSVEQVRRWTLGWSKEAIAVAET
jgi:hypothetical protein